MIANKSGRRGGMRSMLVEPYLQVKLGLIFILVNMIFSIMILGVTGWFLSDIFGTLTTYFQLTGQDAGSVTDKLQFPLAVVGILVFGFVVTTLMFAVAYTHKIYGPLVSINRHLDEVLEGKRPSRLVLREGDQLQDLATKLNLIADKKNH